MNGKPVAGFWAYLNKPGHLITPHDGTHEITRVFYEPADTKNPTGPGVFKLGSAHDRLGPQPVESASYSTSEGIVLTLRDYVLHLPASQVQACWAR